MEPAREHSRRLAQNIIILKTNLHVTSCSEALLAVRRQDAKPDIFGAFFMVDGLVVVPRRKNLVVCRVFEGLGFFPDVWDSLSFSSFAARSIHESLRN
jgi:hypothetical protein